VQKSEFDFPKTNSIPLVSIIVTTRNEEKNIGNCLESIIAQTFKNIELIVVDNFSEDRTVEIAGKYGAKVHLKGPERSTQRNYGAHVSSGEYLLYLDADMILSPNVVAHCVKKCKNSGVGAVYIPEKIVGEGFWIKVRNFERSFYTGTVIDAVRFIQKDLFEKAEGFDESLIGPEDWDFDRKIRKIGRTGIINTPLYHNERSFNMKLYLKKKKYYTNGIKKYVRKWESDNSETIKQTGIWYRLMGVFIEKGKWKRLIRNPLLTVAMYSLRFRVAIEYLRSTA
jgi:glycosyltransferase involved in cell wall biosynthesis